MRTQEHVPRKRPPTFKKFLLTILLLASSAIMEAQHVVLDGNATVKIFTNITGSYIDDLKSAPGFPDTPGATATTKFIEYPNGSDSGTAPPADVADNYGIVISGFLIVDRTDNYVFWLASDDNGEFWLSTDGTAANLSLICREPNWNPVRSYLKDVSGGRSDIAPENVSAPQHLAQGTKYFFTGYMKEGSFGDNFAVAARVVGDNPPPDGSFPIFSAAVSTGVTITSQPQGQAGAVGSTATFSVDVSGPAFFQWNKDGSAIPGATSRSYTTPPLVLEDSGSKYSVTATPVSGAPVTVTSADANLTVVGTRLYTEGVIEYVSWLGNSVTTIDAGKTALGNPIGSYAAGGGTNPSLRMAVDAFDSRVAYPDNSHDNYTGAMFGYFIPDQNGTYYFHLKSDDNGQLFFNPNGSALPDLVTDSDGDGNPDSLVAWETGCCNDFQPAGNMRTGGPFILTANQKYGILGIYHEGGGNDYLQVAVTRDGVVTGLDKTDD